MIKRTPIGTRNPPILTVPPGLLVI
jgi:hypothetical protein